MISLVDFVDQEIVVWTLDGKDGVLVRLESVDTHGVWVTSKVWMDQVPTPTRGEMKEGELEKRPIFFVPFGQLRRALGIAHWIPPNAFHEVAPQKQ